MQRTLFDPARYNSLVAAEFVLKMRQGRKVFWYISKTSERLPNFRRLAHILYRVPAKNGPAPPLGNFADIVYLKEQSFLHRIRDVCTL